MSVFGAPVEVEDHADRALTAARQIVGPGLQALNDWLEERGDYKRFSLGVGLHAGPVMSGNVGSERRIEYTTIGDTTNTASRVESLTKDFGVSLLLTQEVVDALTQPAPDLKFVDEVAPRGRTGTVRLWTVEGT
jgi:adenylate cyclase